jgi:hypothetical protein
MDKKVLTDAQIIQIMKEMTEKEGFWGEDEDSCLEYARMVESAVLRAVLKGGK